MKKASVGPPQAAPPLGVRRCSGKGGLISGGGESAQDLASSHCQRKGMDSFAGGS